MRKGAQGIHGGCGDCAIWLTLGSDRGRPGGVRSEEMELPEPKEGADPRVRRQKGELSHGSNEGGGQESDPRTLERMPMGNF